MNTFSSLDSARITGYIPISEFLNEQENISEILGTYDGEYFALTDMNRLLYVSHFYGDSDKILVPNVARTVDSIMRSEKIELSKAFSFVINLTLQRVDHGDIHSIADSKNIISKLKQITGYVSKPKPKPIPKDNIKQKNDEYVYFLKADNGLTKIGRTSDITKRMHHFTTKLPYELLETLILITDDSTRLEKYLHQNFSEKRVRGEWFYLTDNDIAWVKKNTDKFDIGISVSDTIYNKYVQ